MGNIVSLAKCGQNISMSNGLTSVFISTLGLSGTHLAKTDCFLLNVIEGAKKKIGWEFLDYQPDEELLFHCLDQFYNMISNVNTGMINQTSAQEWLNAAKEVPNDPVVCGYPCCKKHSVFLTVFGCHLCND